MKGKGFEAFNNYRLPIEKLCYMGEGEGLRSKASGRQRGYVHGLLKKIEWDENELLTELDLDVPLSDFSSGEASNAIETLLNIQQEQRGYK